MLQFPQRWLAGLLLLQFPLVWISPVWAKDPFRTGSTARPISTEVEGAFKEFFCAGRYTNSRPKLEAALKTAPQEPMVYALLAALSYQENNLEKFAQFSTKTREVATALKATDPLRGNLYEGVGYGMEGANLVVREGVVIGLPKALSILNSMFGAFRAAQAVDPTDPELNLLNGYIDLLLTNRDKALTQFQRSGPPYMAYRGQALVYRDTAKFGEGLQAVDQAIASACDNPELYYLKAQLLSGLRRDADAVPLFDRALSASAQLPPALVTQIRNERNSAAQRAKAGTPSP